MLKSTSTRYSPETSTQASNNSQGYRIARSFYTRRSFDGPESSESSNSKDYFERK